MTTKVELIENEIRSLDRGELANLRDWFARYDARQWERQIHADLAGGKLDELAAEALAEHKRGKSVLL